jgi:glycosyltransferase involved in cell wall biosynthesis
VTPIVSIVTPCHNGLPYLHDMLASVAAQTLGGWEHIVVDDGSSDGSFEMLEATARCEPRLRIIRQRRGGVAAARKVGYAAASSSSTYVYFLDADDVIEAAMLETIIGYFESHPAVAVVFCDYRYIDTSGQLVETLRIPRYARTWYGARELGANEPLTPLESIYAWAPVMESLSVIRRSAYDETRGWDERVGQPGEGVDLFTEIALRHEVHFVNRPLYRYRRHREQASNDSERLRRQDLRVQLKWRDRHDLSPEQRARINSAQLFRMRTLRAHLAATGVFRYLARGEVRHAVHCGIEIGRTLVETMGRRSPWPTVTTSEIDDRV